ncbi:MAG: hypothetical protein MZW92_72015 [Comamonadaceae bacterium]|nr:hypothetical protein [Comamonadaceae bacterium]
MYDAKGQDVALTYYFQKAVHRHLERLRHRQRHSRWPAPPRRRSRSTTIELPRPTAVAAPTLAGRGR